MRKIVLTGLAVLAVMLGGVIPAQAATGPVARLSAVAATSAVAGPSAGGPSAGTPSAGPSASTSISGSRVSCASATSCLAVSQHVDRAGNSTPAADYWTGSAWKPLAVPLPRGAAAGGLNGVSCKHGSCLAIGSYTTATGDSYPLAWTWTGKALALAAAPPMPAGAVDAMPGDVSCVTASSCVMIGSTFTSSMLSAPTAAPRLIVVIDRWESGKWTMRTVGLTAGTIAEFDGLSCLSASYCVASALGISSSFAIQPLLASWNGTALRLFKAPVPRGVSSALLTDVSCVSAVSCAATGLSMSPSGTTSYGFTDVLAGKTWAAAAIAWPKGSASSLLMAVSCASSRSCVAVGVDGVSNASTANSGHAVAVSYNGKAWTVQKNVPLPARGSVSEFGGVSCVTATRCVASGLLGTASGNAMAPLNGVWNGTSWKLFRLP